MYTHTHTHTEDKWVGSYLRGEATKLIKTISTIEM